LKEKKIKAKVEKKKEREVKNQSILGLPELQQRKEIKNIYKYK
jgi:hypothetical protein